MAQVPTRQRMLASQNLWKHEGLVTTHTGTSMTCTQACAHDTSSELMIDALKIREQV